MSMKQRDRECHQMSQVVVTFVANGRDSGVDKRVLSKRVVFRGCSPGMKTGTRAHSDVNESNEGTFACSPRNETGTRARSPKPLL